MKAQGFIFLFAAALATPSLPGQDLGDSQRALPVRVDSTFQKDLQFNALKPRKDEKAPLVDRPFFSLSWSDWKQTIRELDQESEGSTYRFRETAHPLILERNNLFYQRDLISTTKGIILKKFSEGRFDIGLYQQRYQFLTGPIGFSSLSGRQMIESPQARRFSLTGGGHQVQMTFRIHLDWGARKRSLAKR